jgi:hypothetical protein
MRDEPIGTLKRLNVRSCRSHKRRCQIKTAGRWPWKSEPAKECVTTHLPNLIALKKDGAQADCLYVPVFVMFNKDTKTSRRAWGLRVEVSTP